MKAVSFVGLEAEAHRLVGGLGAGQRRLVEVARAVVGNARGSSCSTSPRPAFPTRRPRISAS